MSALGALAVVLLVIGGALRQLREQRRRGTPFEASKTVATLVASVLVGALTAAALAWGLKADQPLAGLVLSGWAFTVGMTWLVAEVNRRWPPPAGTPYLRIARRTAVYVTVLVTLGAAAAIVAIRAIPA